MHSVGTLPQSGQGEQKWKTPPIHKALFQNAENIPSEGMLLSIQRSWTASNCPI